MIVGALFVGLLEVGQAIRAGFQKTNDWSKFIGSNDFVQLHANIDTVIASVRGPDLRAALADVEQRQQGVLGGRDISALSNGEMESYWALQRLHHALALKTLIEANARQDFARIVMDYVLPALEKAAPLLGLVL